MGEGDYIRSHCVYELASVEDPDVVVAADHVVITAHMSLYDDWSNAPWRDQYPEIPIYSEDLEDWQGTLWVSRDRGVWRESCAPDESCAENSDGGERNHAWTSSFEGRVGSLDFWVTVVYIAEELPADVRERTVEIFRDLVLATLETYERVD